jgi:hypothetical protein
MNIFCTEECPRLSAQSLDNIRVNKMITESLQMLVTAMRLNGAKEEEIPQRVDGIPMKISHINHPCSIWVRESRENYLWLWEHLKALTEEFEFRHGKKHHGASQLKRAYKGSFLIADKPRTSFQNSSIFKNEPTLEAYKATMVNKWKNDVRTPSWGNRERPVWYDLGESLIKKFTMEIQ